MTTNHLIQATSISQKERFQLRAMFTWITAEEVNMGPMEMGQ